MSTVSVVYVITIVLSFVIALLLVYFSKSSSQAKVAADTIVKEATYASFAVPASGALNESLAEKIQEVVISKEDPQELTRELSDIFNKELERGIKLNTQELSRKYENIIQEKSQNEEAAWKKYEKVTVDKKRTEAVIHSIAEGLVVVDAKGKVVMINPAAEKLLGVSKREKIGRHIAEGTKQEQLISLVPDASGKENQEIELGNQDSETKKILRASSAVIEDENGQTVGMVSMLSDITKQKELDRMKASFVANVSHELRTPLVAIDKSVSLILGKSAGEITPTQEQFLSIASRNLRRLTLLINDLLDLSKLEAAKMEVNLQSVSVEKVITESCEGLASWADSKSITFEKKIQEGLPEVNIDANRIIQVLNNLIGNAVKFTPAAGSITVGAVLGKGENEIEVSVKDSGIGIDKEHLEKVFDKFFQVGERIFTDVNGTGIGLSIAKEIVELHGGRIWVESQKGQGAKFIFTLPLHAGNGAPKV
jgi:PAS domain S-box-containing protein